MEASRPQLKSRTRTIATWLWLIPLAVTFAWAIFLVLIWSIQIARDRSFLFLVDAPKGKSVPVWLLEDDLSRDWGDVRPAARRDWIWYRTPIRIYLTILIACLGAGCCLAVRKNWRYHRWFIALAVATLVTAAFHLWAGTHNTHLQDIRYWLFLLFPSSLLLPIWGILIGRDWIRLRNTNQLPTSAEHSITS